MGVHYMHDCACVAIRSSHFGHQPTTESDLIIGSLAKNTHPVCVCVCALCVCVCVLCGVHVCV